MAKLEQASKTIARKSTPTSSTKFDEAIALLKECPTVKFNETIEVAINLGVDAKKI